MLVYGLKIAVMYRQANVCVEIGLRGHTMTTFMLQ